MTQRLILASKSIERRDILSTLNIPFDIIPADIDEKAIRHPDPKVQAELIGRAKAEKVAAENDGIIISGDCFSVANNGEVLEKPEDLEEAKHMLRLLIELGGITYSSLCYLDRQNNIDFADTAESKFAFRRMSEPEIQRYVEIYPVMDWSAAFSTAYPYAMTMVEYVEGSFTGFTHALPMEYLVPNLRKSGFDIK